jgi:hypothetical protein
MLFSTSRRWRRLAIAGLALYTVFVCAAAFEHHDLTCELKTPQHCIACTSSIVGSDPHPAPALGAAPLADAGTAETVHVLYEGALVTFRLSPRSPPTIL